MCEIWRRFQHDSNLSRPRLKMLKDIGTLKETLSAAMIASLPSLEELGLRTPENRSVNKLPHP